VGERGRDDDDDLASMLDQLEMADGDLDLDLGGEL
jgi:hypothetical protein